MRTLCFQPDGSTRKSDAESIISCIKRRKINENPAITRNKLNRHLFRIFIFGFIVRRGQFLYRGAPGFYKCCVFPERISSSIDFFYDTIFNRSSGRYTRNRCIVRDAFEPHYTKRRKTTRNGFFFYYFVCYANEIVRFCFSLTIRVNKRIRVRCAV